MKKTTNISWSDFSTRFRSSSREATANCILWIVQSYIFVRWAPRPKDWQQQTFGVERFWCWNSNVRNTLTSVSPLLLINSIKKLVDFWRMEVTSSDEDSINACRTEKVPIIHLLKLLFLKITFFWVLSTWSMFVPRLLFYSEDSEKPESTEKKNTLSDIKHELQQSFEKRDDYREQGVPLGTHDFSTFFDWSVPNKVPDSNNSLSTPHPHNLLFFLVQLI